MLFWWVAIVQSLQSKWRSAAGVWIPGEESGTYHHTPGAQALINAIIAEQKEREGAVLFCSLSMRMSVIQYCSSPVWTNCFSRWSDLEQTGRWAGHMHANSSPLDARVACARVGTSAGFLDIFIPTQLTWHLGLAAFLLKWMSFSSQLTQRRWGVDFCVTGKCVQKCRFPTYVQCFQANIH